MKRIIIVAPLLMLSACSTVSPNSGNTAEKYCQDRGGTIFARKGLFGITEFCLLPDDTRIEIWRLYLKDHVLP